MTWKAWGILGAVAILCGIVGRVEQRRLDSSALRGRAESALQAGDAIGAIGDFERALRIVPDDGQARGGLALALEARGDTAAAIEAQRRATDLALREAWPLSARVAALRNLGLVLYRHRKLEPAIATFSSIDSLGAGTLETDLVLRAARILNGEAEAVLASFPRLRERYGGIEPLWKLGLSARVARMTGSAPPRRALEMFVGLRAVPGDLGDLRLALASAAAPDPVSQALLARALTDAGQNEEARRLWEPLETGPLTGLAAIGTADAAIAAGHPADALAALDALDARAGDAEVPRETIDYARARALLALGWTEEAREALDRALAANPLSARSAKLRQEIAGR